MSRAAEIAARLGWSALTFDTPEEIPWPEEGVAHGRGLEAVPTLRESVRSATFCSTESASAAALGLELALALGPRRSVEVRSQAGHTLRLQHASSDETVAFLDDADPATSYLDIEGAGPTLVRLPDGRGLLLEMLPDLTLALTPFAPAAAPSAPREHDEALASVPVVDPSQWVAPDDPWLAEALRARLVAPSPAGWNRAVAVGMFIRLRLLTPDEARRALARTAAGEPDPDWAHVRAWARGLSAEHLAAIQEHAEQEGTRLAEAIPAIEGALGLDDPNWRQRLRDLAMTRDDLECVRCVLAALHAPSPALDRLINRLDAAARLFVTSLPTCLGLTNERLRRARLSDPTAWWTRLP